MPRFSLYAHDQDGERAQLVQSYMVLHAKQTSVRRRLSSPSCSPRTSSPDLSPSDNATFSPLRRSATPSSQPLRSPYRPGRQQRSPLLRRPSVPSIPEHPEERDIDSDEEKLSDINASIKSTLTDLLNCESVKHDDRMRNWVQTRLVDAQHSDSRRRSSTPSLHRRSSSTSSAATPSSPTIAWSPTPVYADGVRIDQMAQMAPCDQMRELSI